MNLRQLNPFTDRAFVRRLASLTGPMVLQYLMLASVAVSDALMLGNQAQNAMSAVSLATQIQFVQNITMSAMTAAVSALTAQYWGKGDRKAVQQILSIGLRICTAISLAFCAACICVPETLMLIFTNEQELIAIGADYLRIAGWSYLFTGLSQPILTVLKATGHTKKTAMISSCTVIMNIVLNAALIFGIPGVIPTMGVCGAAIATLISRAFELIWSMFATTNKDCVAIDLKGLFRYNALLSLDFFKCAWPLLAACLFWGVGFVSYSAFMGHMGEDAVAANSVAAVVRDMVCCLCDGLAGGGGVLIGNELGAGHLKEARAHGNKLFVMSFIIGFASTLIMLILTPFVIGMVQLTADAKGYLLGMMAIMAFYMIGRCVNTVTINGVLTAGGDTKFDMYSLAVTMWGIAVPLAALGTFVFHWPVLLVYACTCLDEVGKIPWVYVHFRKYLWVKDLTRKIDP